MKPFSFIGFRKYFYAIAIGLMVISVASPFVFGTRLGIDMTGGVQVEYTCGNNTVCQVKTVDTIAEEVKQGLTSQGKDAMNDIHVYKVAGQETLIVEAGFTQGTRTIEELESLKTEFKDSLTAKLSTLSSAQYTMSRYVNIGESFGAYIKRSAYITLSIAIVMISLYIQYAFRGSIAGMASWPFAIVTGLSLLHDIIVAFGLYVVTSYFFPELKIDTFFLTAMLTILGYSINDTIVVMDRIRSNLKEKTGIKQGFAALIDRAINDTLRRSLFTSLTIVIVLISMFLFGPESIRGFSLALLFGTLIGTYSSVCLAAPLLYDITRKTKAS